MKSMKRNTKQEDNENIKSEAPLWVRWFFHHTRVRDDPEKCSNPQKTKKQVPDNFSDSCMCCNKLFTALNRRHHCRKCGILVCGSCSKGKTFVPEVSRMHSVRICDNCKRRNKVSTVRGEVPNGMKKMDQGSAIMQYLSYSASSRNIKSLRRFDRSSASTIDFFTDSDNEDAETKDKGMASNTLLHRLSSVRDRFASFASSSPKTPQEVEDVKISIASKVKNEDIVKQGELEKAGTRMRGFSKRHVMLTKKVSKLAMIIQKNLLRNMVRKIP